MSPSFVSTIAVAVFILVSHSHAQWVRADGTDSLQLITCFAVKDSFVFAGTYGGNSTLNLRGAFRSVDGGLHWLPIDSALSGGTDFFPSLEAFAVSGSSLFAGTYSGVFLSTDNGTTWTSADSGLTDRYVHTLLCKGTSIFAGTGVANSKLYGGVFRSTDNGSSWKTVDAGLPNLMVTSLALVDSVLFAASYPGYIYRSTDNGENWFPCGLGGTITSLVPSGSGLYATAWDAIFFSTDYGSHWVRADSNMPYHDSQTLTVSGSLLFVGTAFDGALISQNRGASWTPINEGWQTYPYNRSVHALIVVGSNLLAGTDRGVWIRPLSEIIASVHQTSATPPGHFVLYQNYPNPFNPSTTIRYALPSRTHVTLSIFNTLGQQVATLVNESEDAGYHEVRFDGSGLASGVYYYRLQSSGSSKTMRFLVIR